MIYGIIVKCDACGTMVLEKMDAISHVQNG